MSIIVSPQTAQDGRPAARKRRRTNQEMILQPLWEGYLRAIHQQLRRSADFAALFGRPDRLALRDAAEMLGAFTAAVEARRYVAARRTKAERTRYERICLLLSQIEHAVRSVKLAQDGLLFPDAVTGSAADLLERAMAELPKLDQIAGVATHLGFAPCLGEMVSKGIWL